MSKPGYSTSQRELAALPWLCRKGHEHATRNEARICDGRPPVEERAAVVPRPAPQTARRRESTPLALLPKPSGARPSFFETPEGLILCSGCRYKLLTADYSWVRDAEPTQAKDLTNLGRTPWAGNDEGDRYMQCDDCGEQWGPDA